MARRVKNVKMFLCAMVMMSVLLMMGTISSFQLGSISAPRFAVCLFLSLAIPVGCAWLNTWIDGEVSHRRYVAWRRKTRSKKQNRHLVRVK